ncbi:hypothetical protein [Wolbachia endosymbiont (group A) of Cydia splendana]|uniref:hypothetical protein n=1 Tax=Wolbachia endosymbiont (group A) of Cydia splendana TaxID=2954000 RepID=UPI0021F861C4|nr:hypothetical protein [Wolbachia endosymbiont (group A) of Cydia splendana]
MFSASEMNQALVKAFNISVCYNNIINTNLKVQNVHRGLRNKDHIVISFDKSMDADQCMKYLDNMKGRIVETFCGNESTASLSFDMKSFPFNFNRSQLVDSNGKYRFSVPIGQSIVFNLKCLLANGLARDITGAMGRNFGLEHVEEYTSDESFDRKSYLYCMRFYDKRLQEYFIESFSATVKGYKNSPKRTDDFLKVKDNCVYIKKSLFDKTKFINEIEESQACLIGRDLQTSSSDDPAIEKIKYLITGFIRKACPPLYYVFHTSYSGNNEDSILVPIVSYDNYYRFLTKEEVDTINSIFGMVVLNNIESYTSPKHLPVFGSRGIYGIDFSNKEISHCVITKIIKNSVINKDHELAIDPELPRTLLAEASQTQEFPKRSRDEGLERPPRQGSEREGGKRGLFQLVPEEIDSSQSTCGQSQLSSGEIGPSQSTCGQLQLSLTCGSSSIPSLRAWDSSTFLNLEVSNEESEKQQVTDESDRKSSDECSKAKPQKQERDSVYSSASTPEGSVSKKPSLSNPPSGVTSPVTEPDDGGFLNRPKIRALRSKTNGGIPEPLPQDAVSKPNVPGDRNSKISKDSGFESLERPQSNSSITTSTVPGISESRKDLNPPVDNKRPQSLPLAGFSTCASNETVKAFLCFLDYFSSSEGKKQLPSLLSSEAGKQLSSISDPCEQENLLDFLFSTERSKQLCSLFSSENKQQLHSLFSLKGKELLFSPSPEGEKLIPLVLSPKGKEKLPLLLSPEGERISKPFSPEAGNIISLLIYSRVEPKNMSHRSFRDKLAKWLHRNSSLSKVASPQEKPLTNDEKKELRPFLCPKLQKKLDSNSLEDAQLKYLLYTPGGKEKLDLLLSSPEKEEKQLLSDLQKVGGNASTSFADSGCYSGSSSQKSTSDTGSDEDELEASGRSSVSSNSSTSTVRTKMDATKIEQYLQEKKVNSRT